MSATPRLNDVVQPLVLRGTRGLLTAVHYQPPSATNLLGTIVVVPAFAEEMNRCRAMVAMQAREFARMGVATLVLDPFGTGDSAGDFSEADASGWCNDLTLGVEWARTHGGGCIALWGIRLGALLAMSIAVENPDVPHIILWQPVTKGRVFLTQFLRIRIAAEMERRDGVKSTEDLRQSAAAGGIVEVSGYRMGPRLMQDIDSLTLPEPKDLLERKLTWLEVVASEDTPYGNAHTVQELVRQGVNVDARTVVGPSFWQLHDRTIATALIEATSKVVATIQRDLTPGSARAAKPLDKVARVSSAERPLTFACCDETLFGIAHEPAASSANCGVVIVVAGGPQYRAGAHRQFVALARRLAARGFPVLRFDLRGMGDSTGEHLGYEDSGPDIRAAIDELCARHPDMQDVVLFGECESATGILFYAHRDPRVTGIALVNPWVRTESGRAEVIVKHYYLDRLRSREFWRKVASGRYDVTASMKSLVGVLRTYAGVRRVRSLRPGSDLAEVDALPLPVRTAACLGRFAGEVLLLMSGKDYIAREFDEVARSTDAWRGLLDAPRVRRHVLEDADHTFSREEWKLQVAQWVGDWLDARWQRSPSEAASQRSSATSSL